jgi:putative ABC transport system substrate-binding protein
VIATLGSTPAALAAKAATTTIAIVFFTGFDPVKVGLVGSLNRPGGNVTGVTSLNAETGPKRLEMLRELIPGAVIIVLLSNPNNPAAETESNELEAVARQLGLRFHALHANRDQNIESTFTNLAELRAEALVLSNDGFFYSRRKQLVDLARRYAVPTIFPWRDAVTDGGLMSYGGSLGDAHRQVGIYTGRILKGDKPLDLLPVVQATKVELIINRKTAQALGLTVPPTLLVLADEVIE